MVLLKELFQQKLKENKRERRIVHHSRQTGLRNVFLVKCARCKQGFLYQYRYINKQGDRALLQSVSLESLKARATDLGLDWDEYNISLLEPNIKKLLEG